MSLSTRTERPLSLSAGCVRAILCGQKTQVRYPVEDPSARCPLGDPGDHLWVQEPWAWSDTPSGSVIYRATEPGPNPGAVWRAAKDLPREHSRILLRTETVRLERLQDVPEDDLPREGRLWQGNPNWGAMSEREGFAAWWDSVHPKEETRWQTNPWVWVVSFSLVCDPPSRRSEP